MSVRAAFRYGDLLHLGYERDQLDPRTGRISCAGVCRIVLERLGYDPAILPASVGDVATELARPWLHERWETLGDDPALARRLGDTVVSLSRSGDSHVSTVVQEHPPRVISSAESCGVYTARPSRVSRVLGVLRPRP